MCLGKTHVLAGAATGAAWSEFVAHGPPLYTAVFSGFTGALALWPDADHCGSSVSRSLGFFSRTVSKVVNKISGGHRHGTHSALGIAVTAGLAWLACRFLHTPAPWAWIADAFLAVILTFSISGMLECTKLLKSHAADATAIAVSAAVIWRGYGLGMIPLAVAVGCAAHVATDMLTDSGAPLLWPVSDYRFKWWPEPFAFTTGTKPETLIIAPACLTSLAVLALLAIPGAGSNVIAWAHTL